MLISDPRLLADSLRHRDLTQAQLGRRVGLSRQVIWALVHGVQGSCTAENATRIEVALDLPPGTLFRPDVDELARTGSKADVAA